MMNKTIQWIIWGVALVAINIPAISFASLSLFATEEGTGLFSIDYLIAAGIVITANVIILQLFLAIIKNHYKGFVYGLIITVALAASLYLFAATFVMPWLVVTGVFLLAAIGLLIKEITSK